MMNRIQYMAWRYHDAFERNFDRWPIMGEFVWPNPDRVVVIDTFAGQVDYLVEWLEIRIEGFGDFLHTGGIGHENYHCCRKAPGFSRGECQ